MRIALVLALFTASLAADEVPLAREPVDFSPEVEDFWASSYGLYGAWHSCQTPPPGYSGDLRSAHWALGEFAIGGRSTWVALDESGGTGTGFDRVLVDLDGDRTFEADEERLLEAGRARVELPAQDGEPIAVAIHSFTGHVPRKELPEWFSRLLEGLGPRGNEIEAELLELTRRARSALAELQSREGWPEEFGDLVPPPDEIFYMMRVGPAEARLGRMKVGDSEVRIGVADTWSASVDGGPGLILVLDSDGDGTIAPEETQPLDSVLLVGGRTYRASLAPDGKSLTVEPAGIETGLLAVDPALVGTRLVFESTTHGTFPLVLAPETRIPVGNYSLRYSMTRVVEGGDRWTLSSRGSLALEVAAGTAAFQAIDPKVVPAVEMTHEGTELSFQLSLADGNGVPVSLQEDGATADVGFSLRDDRKSEIFRGAFHPG